MAVFDVYKAKVYFSDDLTKYKIRPVVQVLAEEYAPNSFAVITTNLSRTSIGEVLIEDYKKCGLTKPSCIRLTQRLTCPEHKEQIGTLDRGTILTIIKQLNKNYKTTIHKTEELDDEFTISSILMEVTE